MYRIFVITGLCILAIIVTVGQLSRHLPDYTGADRGQKAQHSQQQEAQQQDFHNSEKRQQQSRLFFPADLSLSDMTAYGVTITNHSKSTVKEITFEVTMKDCPPGYNPSAAHSDDQCVIAGQESKGVDVFIPPGQARGFRTQMNLHDVPFSARARRFFLWRIVSAKGIDAP